MNLGVASVIKRMTKSREHRSGRWAKCSWAVGAVAGECWSVSVYLEPPDRHILSLFRGDRIDKLECWFCLVT